MIAFEHERQAEQAVQLWREAFGDKDDYIRFFFHHHEDAAALTESVNGSLVSALYLLDGALLVDSRPIDAYYLFAAATFKAFRGQGHMARLLRKAEEYAEHNARQFIALVPASPALFDYYARFGYQTAFFAKELPAGTHFEFDRAFDRFEWSAAHLRYMRAEAEAFHFPLREVDGMLFSVDDNSIRIPDPERKNPIGMLLPLNEDAKAIMPQNAYIGLTME